MDPFLLIAILTPLVTRAIAAAEKKFGTGKGSRKKTSATSEIVKSWNDSVAAGLITGDLAKLPISLIMPFISMLIDQLILVINNTPVKTKNPKTGVKK